MGSDWRAGSCSSSYLAESLLLKNAPESRKTLERSVSGLSGGSLIILLMWHPPCTNPGNTSHPHPPRVHHIVETQLHKIQHFPPPPEHRRLTQRMGSRGANFFLRNRACLTTWDLHFSATAQLLPSSSLVIVQEYVGFNQRRPASSNNIFHKAIPFFQSFQIQHWIVCLKSNQ